MFGVGGGWRVAPEHFAERHGLIILIALGESIISIGVGAGFDLVPGVVVAAFLGIAVVSALWWLYFDVAAIFARRRLMQLSGLERARLARDDPGCARGAGARGACLRECRVLAGGGVRKRLPVASTESRAGTPSWLNDETCTLAVHSRTWAYPRELLRGWVEMSGDD